MSDRTKLTSHLVLLIALCGILYFPYLGNVSFFDKGEPREALAVQDIVQRGEWLFPLKRATAIPSKPPLFHWSAALVAKVTGKLDETTIRFPSALYATLGVLFVYVLGRKLYGGVIGLLAGAILATTMVYNDQALSARVDMTLCFFVTLSLVLFYALYRGFLIHSLWYFALYALVGIGTLAKGPLGILLPGLVIAVFLAVKRKWDLILKFAFHPGVIITLLLAVGWYGMAFTRGGEGFVDRQLLQENLKRFFGGSGHSHPVYYYFSYLFSLGLPWSLILPFMLWDVFQPGARGDDDRLFFKSWFLVMFVFFSLSAGKRPVYLLPLYPPLALLLAAWVYHHGVSTGARLILYRIVAGVAVLTGALLLVITIGALWNHEPGWFFGPIARFAQAEGPRQPVGRSRCLGHVWRGIHRGSVLIRRTLVGARTRLLARQDPPSGSAARIHRRVAWIHQPGRRYPRDRDEQKLSRLCHEHGAANRARNGGLSFRGIQQRPRSVLSRQGDRAARAAAR